MAGATFYQVGGFSNVTANLRRVLAHMLQQYFAKQTGVNELRWVDDLNETGIFIADAYPADTDAKDLRPAIIIERSAFQKQSLGLRNDITHEDLAKDEVTYAWNMHGTIKLNCVSRYGLESEAIAWVVHDLIALYQGRISRRVPLNHVGRSVIGQETEYVGSPRLRADENYWSNVPVTFEVYLNREFKIQRDPGNTLDQVATRQPK